VQLSILNYCINELDEKDEKYKRFNRGLINLRILQANLIPVSSSNDIPFVPVLTGYLSTQRTSPELQLTAAKYLAINQFEAAITFPADIQKIYEVMAPENRAEFLQLFNSELLKKIIVPMIQNFGMKECLNKFEEINNISPDLYKNVLLTINQIYYDNRQANEKQYYSIFGIFSKNDKLTASKRLETLFKSSHMKLSIFNDAALMQGDLGRIASKMEKACKSAVPVSSSPQIACAN
jgi:hypothetical protein